MLTMLSYAKKHDLELLIVGSMDEINQRQLDDFRRSNPQAADRIHVVGPLPNDEMPQYMQQADILVHPRLGDWCPNTVVEAMACGLPVVCGRWGGAAEVVGDAGRVVPTNEWEYGEKFVEGLSQAVVHILENLNHYRTAARTRAEAKFDIRQVASAYLQALGLAEA